MKNCQDCSLFAKHMASQAQGSALEILNDKQRCHWRLVFKGELKKSCKEGFRLGMKEGEEETGRLRDELKKLREKLRWHYNKVDNMEDKNKNLQHEVRRLRDDLHQTNDIWYGSASQGGAHTGLTSHDRRDIHSQMELPLVTLVTSWGSCLPDRQDRPVHNSTTDTLPQATGRRYQNGLAQGP